MDNFEAIEPTPATSQGVRISDSGAIRGDYLRKVCDGKIGVVVPCKGDEHLLPECLHSLKEFQLAGDSIVLVDGDGNAELAHDIQSRGLTYLQTEDSRRGSAIGCGIAWLLQNDHVDVLLICHADMRLAYGTRAAMLGAVGHNARLAWGWMGHRIDDWRWRYRLIEWGNSWRGAALHLPYGDQLMFVGSDLLAQTGGWPMQPTMEDIELSLRLRRVTPPVHVKTPTWIGSRHWREGVVKTTLRNWHTAWRYAAHRRPSCKGVTCLMTKS